MSDRISACNLAERVWFSLGTKKGNSPAANIRGDPGSVSPGGAIAAEQPQASRGTNPSTVQALKILRPIFQRENHILRSLRPCLPRGHNTLRILSPCPRREKHTLRGLRPCSRRENNIPRILRSCLQRESNTLRGLRLCSSRLKRPPKYPQTFSPAAKVPPEAPYNQPLKPAGCR